MMNSVSRLQKYSTLAAAPCAALGVLAVGGISVEASAGSNFGWVVARAAPLPGGSTGTWSNKAVFAAGGIDFNLFAFCNSSSSASMGLSIDNRGEAGRMKFWSGSTQSKVISGSATGVGHTNSGYGGSQVGNFNELGTGSSHHSDLTGWTPRYLGFFVQNELTSDYVAGWINFGFDRTAGERAFTIYDWAYNVGDSDTSITMPANGGAAAVPGIGGLAALAMGAAGMRRKRQRVA